jgi:hypothetical protein
VGNLQLEYLPVAESRNRQKSLAETRFVTPVATEQAETGSRGVELFMVQRQDVQPEFCAPPAVAKPVASWGNSRDEL